MLRGGLPSAFLLAWEALKTQSMNKSAQFDPFKYQMVPYPALGTTDMLEHAGSFPWWKKPPQGGLREPSIMQQS